MIQHMRYLLTASIVLLTTVVGQAQKKTPSDPNDSTFFAALKYRLIGPFRGGRADAVSGSLKNRNTFYFGATGGGLWKTMDGGSNWKNVSDGYFGGGVGAVAVAPSDESIVYAGEGESTLRNNVSENLGGVWRSDNGGRSWRDLGLKDSRHIARIVVHPANPDIVWVAVMGHLFGRSTERGVFKTTDGGKTWRKVLFVNDQTACSDVVMEPGNPSVLYAGMWRVKRTPYSMESGGEGSGLYKSTDGGETWTNISAKKGLPKGVWGVVNVAVPAANPDKVYAMIENAEGGLFLSTDRGDTWTKVNSTNDIRQRAWYYNRVYCDPKNENIVYVLNVQFQRSLDGGKTFASVASPHSDHHDLWIDPEDSHRLILADDGGAQVSFNAGEDWSSVDNQPTAQIYRVTTDNAFPYHILGAQQDNTSVRIKSRSTGPAITGKDWEPTAGFESGYIVPDPLNPDIVYGGNYDGYLGRLNHRTGENRSIDVWPDNPTGSGADSLKYRFQWNYPIFFSPHNPHRLYAAGNQLFVTENEGQTWETISPDLTTNDKSRQGPSGGPITKDNTSAEYYCTIFTATESALEKDLLYTGSDDGLIHVSKDGGKHWDDITPPQAGKWTLWNCVEADPFKKGVAYFAGTRFREDDYTPYLFKTEDYGKTWRLITKGIDPRHFTRVIRADRKRPGLLYAGTEYGMYISYDGGDNWRPFQLNLPIVPVTDLTIKDNDLIVATQGRAFWALDGLSLLQQQSPDLLKKRLHVFAVDDAWRTEGGGRRRRDQQPIHNAGQNPPNGVVFRYWLKSPADTPKVSITIFDKQQKPIRTFTTRSKDADTRLDCESGINTFVWDMLYAPAEKITGMLLWTGGAGAPKAAPGKYTARFKYDDDSTDVAFAIKGDPNYQLTEADYDAQTGFLLQIRDKYNEAQKAILQIRSVRTQLQDFNSRLDSTQKPIKKLSDSLIRNLTAIEEALYQTKSKSGQDMLNFPIRLNDKLSGVYGYASEGYAAPNRQAREVFASLSARTDAQLDKLKNILNTGIPALNKLAYQQQIPVISVKENPTTN
ncbi:VPS10 domain-containing protein [Puia sp. P3]|uniref:VPS10 domain-containing protein n=1 Tax=Puia sp. P3 TaxID=3423952 RepID=UPI003D67294C